MVKFEKILLKFIENPGSVRLDEIERILLFHWFERREGKWSHIVFKHSEKGTITIPAHNKDCKVFYKKKVKKMLLGE